MAGFQWGLLKSHVRTALSPGRRALLPVAGEVVERAVIVASDLVRRQHAALETASDELGFRLNDQMLLSLELNFLWGVFSELVAEGPVLPTNGFAA